MPSKPAADDPQPITIPADAPAISSTAPAGAAVDDPLAPKVDMESALKTARKFANERADTPVGQIGPPELRKETRLATAISRAKRPDCKDGLPGGLLGPILILFDKKDHGCQL